MSRPLGPLHPYVEAMLAKARYDYSLPRDLESKVWDAGPEKFAKPGHERCKEMAGTQSRGIVYQNTGTRHTPTGPMDENEPTLCTCVRKWVKENGLRPRTVKKSRGDTSPPCTVPNCPQCALRARGGGGLCGTCEHPKWTHNDQTDQKTSWAPSRGWCGHGYQGCAWDKDDQEPRHQFKPMEVEDKLPGDIRDLKIEKARGEGDDAVLARHCAPSTPKEFAATTGHAGFVSRSGRIHEFDPYQTHDEALAPDSTPPHALRIGHYGGKQPEFFAEVHHTATPEQHRTVREIARRTSREGTSFNWECHCGQQGSGVDAYEKHHGLTKSRDPMTDTVTPIMKAMATPTVVVVRHPETKLNREGKTRGWLDPGLDAEGRKDGEKVTKEIVGKFSIGRVISSDMKRTETLAKMIGKAAGVKVETERALRPWNLGEMTGKPSKSVFPQMIDYVDNKPNKSTQNGESWYDFLRRSLGFLDGVLKDTRDDSKVTVIITHTRNIRTLLGWIEDDSEKGIDKFVHEEKDPVEPADFVVLRYEGKKWVADKKVEGPKDAGRLTKAYSPYRAIAMQYAKDHGLDYAAHRKEHRATWHPKYSGWDVTCKCGWESRTGGAIRQRVLEDHHMHVFDTLADKVSPVQKSLVKAGPPSQKSQDKDKGSDKSQKPGEAAQPQASLQDIKPGPSKIDHTTVPHGKKVWVAIKSGPLAGRPVVIRRKESGHFTLAQSKTAPTAAGRRPIAEPSAAHKTLYPEVTGDDAETQASIGIAHQGVQGAGSGQTIDESLPNARKDMNDAGVEPWHRTPSIGEGYYAEPGFPLAPEKDLDLHMSGSRRSVRWVTAKMASEGKQHQAFIFHQTQMGKTSGTRISIEQTRGKVFEKALAEVAKQSPGQGWHVRYDNTGKPKEITLVGLGKEKKEHRAFVKRFRAVLQMRGIKVGKNYHDQMDVESLCDDKPDASGRCATHGGQTYDAVLKRGHGFKGWYDGPTLSGGRGQRGAQTGGGDSAGVETAVHAGGTGGGGAEHSGRAGQQRVGGIEPGGDSTEPPVDPYGDEVRASDKEDTATLVKQAVRRARRNKNLSKYDYTTEDRAAIRAMKADPAHVKELTRVYKSLSADERAAGHGWYHVTRAKIKHMARTHGVDYKVAAAVVAAMSPRTGWANNLRSANRLFEQHVKGAGMPTRPEDIGYGGYTDNMIKGWRILKGESPQVVLDETAERTSGDKVRNFYRNFMNDQHAVTVDTWAQKGADRDRVARAVGKSSQYQPYVNAYKKAALKLGITPEALQAAVWLKVRTDEEKKPGARNPWSKQEEGGYVPEGAYLKSQVAFDPGVIMRKSVVSDQENDLGNEREQLRQRLLRLPATGVAHDAVTRLIEDIDGLVA